jgi:phosphoadenosine phosphosulfate reductase
VVDGIVRLHPIEDWSDQDVLDYLTTKMDVPPHYTIKHSSLDCYDCPAYTSESKDRLQWTKAHYPEFYTAYAVRLAAIDGALLEALNGSVEHAESL